MLSDRKDSYQDDFKKMVGRIIRNKKESLKLFVQESNGDELNRLLDVIGSEDYPGDPFVSEIIDTIHYRLGSVADA